MNHAERQFHEGELETESEEQKRRRRERAARLKSMASQAGLGQNISLGLLETLPVVTAVSILGLPPGVILTELANLSRPLAPLPSAKRPTARAGGRG